MSAHLLALAISLSYVVAVHAGQPLGADRNDPGVIRGRMRRVAALCLVLAVAVPLATGGGWRSLRLTPSSGDWRCVAAIVWLYAGPICDSAYRHQWSVARWARDAAAELSLIWGLRDLVFAPISEEFVYRALVLLVYQPVVDAGGTTPVLVVWATPLLFGVAHVHHGYALYRAKGMALSMVCFNGAIQLAYTTAFGALANRWALRDGSIYGSVAAHALCNCLGFPTLVPDMPAAVYHGLLVAGIAGFFVMM